MSPPTTNWW